MYVHNIENSLMMTQTVGRNRILVAACLPTLWGWEIVNVSGLSLRLSPTWAARWRLLKREDRTTGQTLVSCLTHSVSSCQSLDMSEALLYAFSHFHSAAWLFPFSTSPPDVDWFSSSSNCLRSPNWLRLQIAFPNFSGVKLKWKRNYALDAEIRCEWICLSSHHCRNEKLNL